jgi:hypothetical protein
MNYFINTYGIPIFVVFLLANIGILMLVLAFLARLEKKMTFIGEKFRASLSITVLILVFLANLFIYRGLSDYFNDGKIKQLYFSEYNGKPRLAVWFIRTDHGRGATYFSHRTKSYGLLDGKENGRLDLFRGTVNSSGFNIFQPNDHRAWAISGKEGLLLLDLARSKLIADKFELLRINPQLGKDFRPVPGDYAHDPVTQTIHVTSIDGSLFRINNSLMAIPAKDIIKRPWTTPSARWIFETVKGSQGKALRRIPSVIKQNLAKRAVLLNPEIPKELGRKPSQKLKIWVTHDSAVNPDADPLLSYLDANGSELNTLNLREIFNNRNVEVLATLDNDHETFIFASLGGYSLTALRADSETGQIKGRIDYL